MNTLQQANVPIHLPHTRPVNLAPRQAPHALKTPQPVPFERATNDTSPAPDALDNPAALKRALGERCNWKELAAVSRTLLEDAHNALPGGDIKLLASRLATRSLPVCEDSSYYQKHNLTPTQCFVKLHTYLTGSGLPVPSTADELRTLYQLAITHTQTHPLGNFSGALSWPVPISIQDRHAILDLLNAPGSTLPGLPLANPKKGALSYLLSGSDLSDDDLKKPGNAVEKLLGSAKAQALGLAIQARLGGIATTSSVNDYLLTAIQLSLDPEALNTPARHSVAGFDLGQRQHWGQSAAEVIEGLSQYLVAHGRASPPSADLAARLLLARAAPEYLIKDIPPTVTYGTIPWAQLAIAAARLEAQAPGRVLTMTYSEVLAGAEGVDVDVPLAQSIQREALSHWAAVNGLLTATPLPTDADIQRTFITQQNALHATATALATPIPDREAMALELLRDAFPGVADSVFKAKSILKGRLQEGRPGRFPGQHSMLDIVMHGDAVKPDAQEHWVTNDKRIPIETFCVKSASGKLSVADAFAERYQQAIGTLEKGHMRLSQYLISTLPPQDRENLEYGQLDFFHTNDYLIGMDFWTKTLSKRGHTLDVKTTRNGQVNVYRIDTQAGTVSKHNYLSSTYLPPYDNLETRTANTLHKTVRFNPFEDEHAEQAKEQPTTSHTLQAFGSDRTHYIARVLANALDLHNDDLLQHARGVSSYDESAAADAAIGEFFLNLIPFRSATVNFIQGNVADGVLDLGIDVIGLVTLGAGKAAQAGKVFARGAATVKGASKAVRFLGSVATEALNPLSGTGDLLRGVGRLAHRGAGVGREAVNSLRGASGRYDLLKAAGSQHGLAAVGTSKVAGQRLDGGAVFRNGNWYAFDVTKAVPYGAPLVDFQPRVVATGKEVKVLNQPALQDYEASVAPDRLQVKGLQANVYVGAGNSEYIKIDGRFYRSSLEDGQRVVLHPTGGRDSVAVRDLGSAGWEPSATTNRLLGGQPDTLPAWKLDRDTYVVPVDDVKIHTDSSYPYTINYQGLNHMVRFDGQVGAWRSGNAADGKTPLYFWRSAKNGWQEGPLAKMKQGRPLDARNFRFIQAPPPAILQMPDNIRPIPNDIHYFWAGADLPASMVNTMVKNAEKMPGFTSIVHIDADTPELFQSIKLKLETDAPGITVMNLHDDDFFQSLKTTDLYAYFRQGQGKNLAAASDVARYPLMNKYGGIYLDTDDVIQGAVGATGLNAGDSDMLVSRPVTHKLTNNQPFFNTSNFATQAGNPVLTEMITEMNGRFVKNKAYFEANRPTATRDATGQVNYTPQFLEYEGKVFETVGPRMFDDVLKSRRPDIYDAGFDGMSKETRQVNGRLQPGMPFDVESDIRQYYQRKGLMAPDGFEQNVQEAKKHYQAFREQLQIKIGAEHSWIDA